MEQQALLLLLLDKVRQQKQQLEEQAPLFTWAQKLVPRLWFENVHGQDEKQCFADNFVAHSLHVAENTQDRTAIAKDAYWNPIRSRSVETNRKITLVVSDTELCVRSQSVPNVGIGTLLCRSFVEAGQARLWHYGMVSYTNPLLYPLLYKTQVDAKLLEAAKRFGWEVLLPEK